MPKVWLYPGRTNPPSVTLRDPTTYVSTVVVVSTDTGKLTDSILAILFGSRNGLTRMARGTDLPVAIDTFDLIDFAYNGDTNVLIRTGQN